jgi:hypothetical protein
VSRRDFVEFIHPPGVTVSPRLRAVIDDKLTCNRTAELTVVCPECQEALAWLLRDDGELVLVSMVLSTPAPDRQRRDRRPQPQRYVDFIAQTDTSDWEVECNRFHNWYLCRRWLSEQHEQHRKRSPAPGLDEHRNHFCGVLYDEPCPER